MSHGVKDLKCIVCLNPLGDLKSPAQDKIIGFEIVHCYGIFNRHEKNDQKVRCVKCKTFLVIQWKIS